ncbi:type IV pili methyl-accepting chemotaxis transducer N-terminal domain-containing protein [uncultured Dechloromonas sp.]|uniref:type IV pili methyl-accepting chemotaxis transducer N-terminal domain-containing protein n=1 Tax=uncultured Dechloromonas sp. TaxID=171719 RepID=UPI0025E125B2|nr:type IV pili methyl-accepting chemotaxis transducer N-terminal domain-containing protein [uncultured Dechloromonas sp.]
MPQAGFIRFSGALFLSSSLLLAAPATHAIAQPVAAVKQADAAVLAQDIASAGRVRMQSQRLAKLYLQSGIGLNGGAARQQIDQGIGDVDAEFARLARQARKSGIQRTYARSEALWQEMRVALKKAPDAASAEGVGLLADELMTHAGKLAMLIEGESETPVGRLLDLSSRLNMLSQRLARLYLQAYGGKHTQGVAVDIEQARKEFASGLQELDAARENSPASREAIGLARNQWIFFESAIAELGKADRREGKSAQHVATSSERIAQVLDQASLQYVRDYADGLRGSR